jgi:hypothetical protein
MSAESLFIGTEGAPPMAAPPPIGENSALYRPQLVFSKLLYMAH